MGVWHIDQDAQDRGSIVHIALPRFSARWITATAVQIAPDQASFSRLMREAVREVDAWIARRL